MASSGKEAKKKEDNENSTAVVAIRRHHKHAYAYLDKALSIEESDGKSVISKEQAVECYKKGINELTKGIQIDCSGEGEEWERGRGLQSKMQKNLTTFQARLDELVDSKANSKTNGAQPVFKTPLSKRPSSSKAPRNNIPGMRNGGTKASVEKCRPSQNPKLKRHVDKDPEDSPRSSFRPSTVSNDWKIELKRRVSKIKSFDEKIINQIVDEVVQNSSSITFEDVAGMDTAKRLLQEIVILPALRPELFRGLRAPARGLLLYGPPGNGKTMLAKAVSHQAKSTFFNISAATLTSKWVGEGEKLVRALFVIARELQPSIIFIDEIDSLLCERKEGEQESTRRLKTEFLLAFDGITSGENERILVMGATNRPQELDDAALRRFVKRVYLPLPDCKTRKILLVKLLEKQNNPLSNKELDKLASLTENYSGSDLTALAKDAALGPIREMNPDELRRVSASKVRNLTLDDFVSSMNNVRASVSPETLKIFENWTKTYGTQS
ncbi:spastin-like isoform X2 [Xenia sp. Carnegie-2017]|uniref:spastin-like isoform X2 n=1 Tax=Xenia sp. Carnegie-2017 TaxID=2897299 RepID=UPI001F0413C1|nr:spastin-like isoform X2 [Xenia sp. Carnegie-2017]